MQIDYRINYFEIKLSQLDYELCEIIPDIELSQDENFYLVQEIRKSFPTNLFLEWSNKLYILRDFVNDFLEKIGGINLEVLGVGEFETGESLELNLLDQDNVNLTRLFLGQILATQLRLKNFLVQQRGSFAFHASLPKRVESFGFLEAWPGFEFHFELIDEVVYLIIDSKHKLNWLQNARSQSELKIFQKEGRFLDPIKDICSVTDCSERKNSYCRCKLGGVGQTVYFHEVKSEKPTEKFNVIHFLDEIKCPTKLLTESIKDEEPILMASTHRSEDAVKYPLERISRIPSFDLIKSNADTKQLSQRLQPPPSLRYNKIMEYYNTIEKIAIEHFPKVAIETMIDSEKTKKETYTFERKKFLFKNGASKNVNSIQNLGSISSSSIQKLYYINLIEQETEEKNDEIISYLLNKNEIFEGLFNYLNITQIPILKISIEEIKKLKQGNVVLLILERENQDHIYREIKQKNAKRNISVQKITYDDFITSRNKRTSIARNHLRNISLSWFSKSGGTPYVLDNLERGESFIVGWFINTRKVPKSNISQIRLSLVLYRSNGKYVQSKFITIPKNEYSKYGGEVISKFIEENSTSNCQIRVLKLGRIYDEIEKTVIEELKQKISNLTILLIKEGIYRLFKLQRKNNSTIHLRPRTGTVMAIGKYEYLMITTTIKKEEDKSRTQQPIYCGILHHKDEDVITILEEIFDLTYSHHGYTLSRSKLPIPLHACKLMQRIFQPFQLENGFEVDSNVAYFY